MHSKYVLTSYQSLNYLCNLLSEKNYDFFRNTPLMKIILAFCFLRNAKFSDYDSFRRNRYFMDALNLSALPEKTEILTFISRFNFKTLYDILINHRQENNTIKNYYIKKITNFFLEAGLQDDEIPSSSIDIIGRFASECIVELADKKLCPELLTSSLIDQKFLTDFIEEGYVLLHNAIDYNLIKDAKKELDKIRNYELASNIAHFYGEDFKLQRVYNLLDKSRIFLDILNTPCLSQAMELFFDRNTLHDKFYLSSFQSNTLLAGAREQIWHIDANVPPPIPNWTMRVQSAILLDAFTSKNGSTEILPKSHKLLKIPNLHDRIDKNKIVKVIAEPGTIVFWNGNTWHRSTANEDTNDRSALLACFSTSFFREVSQEENHFRIIEGKKLASFPENVKRFIGYNHGIKRGVRKYN